MAVTKAEGQILWSAANSLSVAASSTGTSDAFTTGTNVFRQFVQVQANNDGTPATGDTMDFYLLTEIGDLEGGGGDDFTTVEDAHRAHLIRLIVNATDGGADPAVSTTIEIPLSTSFKIQAKNNSSARACTASARVLEFSA